MGVAWPARAAFRGNAGMAGASTSGGSGGAGASGGTAGAAAGAGGSGDGSDMRRFVPDIPNIYDGTVVDPGIEVVAHTLREGTLGAEWLVAIENTGTDFICSIDIQNRFLDAAGSQLPPVARSSRCPLARGSSGTGILVQCLGPGEFGMAVTESLGNVDDTSVIASVRHSFGALILTDAASTDDIVVTGVSIMKDAQNRNQYTGQVRNDSSVPVRNPDISIFGVNAVGRPLVEVLGNIQLTTIAAGASWTFTTGAFTESVADYAAFPKVTD